MAKNGEQAVKAGDKRRQRSPNYPAVSLPNAVDRLRRLYEADGKAGAPMATAVRHFGFSGPHGQAMAVVSALKKFGLVEDRGGRIVPTPLAIDLMEFPSDHSRHQKSLMEAALMPAIYNELVEAYTEHGRIPSDDSLRGELIADKGFNPKAVDGFLNDFRSTLAAARLLDGNTLKLSSIRQEVPNPKELTLKVGDFVQWTSGGVDQFDEPRKVVGLSEDGLWVFVQGSQTGVAMKEVNKQEATKYDPGHSPSAPAPSSPYYKQDDVGFASAGHKWEVERRSLDEGPVEFKIPGNLSKESVDDLEYWVEGILRRLRRKVDK